MQLAQLTHTTLRLAGQIKGEMRLKQKSMSSAKDHYLTTNDFTEIRENFVLGMWKYLVMCEEDEESGPGGVRALECADMFAEFFVYFTLPHRFQVDSTYST